MCGWQPRSSTKQKQIYHKRLRPSDVWQLPKQQMTMMIGAMMTLVMSCLQCKENDEYVTFRNCGISCTVEIARKMPYMPWGLFIICQNLSMINVARIQFSQGCWAESSHERSRASRIKKAQLYVYWIKMIAPPFSAQQRTTVQLHG